MAESGEPAVPHDDEVNSNQLPENKKLKSKKRRQGNVQQSIDFLAVIDFEATCEKNNPKDYRHEIIEFPVVLVDTAQGEIVDEFQSYVRPIHKPELSAFCTELTGITQAKVNMSDTFPTVLNRVHEWFNNHQLGAPGRTFAVATDGPWDMARFMHHQCLTSNIQFPQWALQWVNIRKAFGRHYRLKQLKLVQMLEKVGLKFDGTEHSGIDDSRNIARIALRLMTDQCELQVNECIDPNKLHKPFLDKYDILQVPRQRKHREPSGTSGTSQSSAGSVNDAAQGMEALNLSAASSVESFSGSWSPLRHHHGNTTPARTMPPNCDTSPAQSDDGAEDLLLYYALQKS